MPLFMTVMEFRQRRVAVKRLNETVNVGWLLLVLWGVISAGISSAGAQEPAGESISPDSYLSWKTQQLTDRCLAGIKTADDWNSRRSDFVGQLQEMLGLNPWPERTPLNPVVTGRLEREDFRVEKLTFESLPGLYVTGDLYLPRSGTGPFPAILYVCGHAAQKRGEASLGNKTAYQHHGIWFARNGYVCLVIDTIQLGEIQGIHHGTYNKGMWWWHSRGYTPAGVEAWNGIRALDYLQSRAEVDPERIGMTGRSGGGAYTWYVSALDERVKVAVPVAGIASLHNHIVDGCISGHCDCMYLVNSYGWDFPQLAALIAPRPLLISNQDTDHIFPLDGVVDVFQKTRRIYQLLGAGDRIGLCIAAGGHEDIQELQVDAFRWFNHFLKGDTSQISMLAEPMFPPEELTVFEQLPADERVTSVQNWMTPQRHPLRQATSLAEFRKSMEPARQHLLRVSESKAGLLTSSSIGDHATLELKEASQQLRLRKFEFTSTPGIPLAMYVVDHADPAKSLPVTLEILNEKTWGQQMGALANTFPELKVTGLMPTGEQFESEFQGTRIYFAPCGIGENRWPADPKQMTHLLRRFALLGTTADGLWAHDVATAVQAAAAILNVDPRQIALAASGSAASWALHAAWISPACGPLTLIDLPETGKEGPQYLALQQFAGTEDVLAAVAASGVAVTLVSTTDSARARWQPGQQAAAKLGITDITIAE